MSNKQVDILQKGLDFLNYSIYSEVNLEQVAETAGIIPSSQYSGLIRE